jgi:hypothetical protein
MPLTERLELTVASLVHDEVKNATSPVEGTPIPPPLPQLAGLDDQLEAFDVSPPALPTQ